MCSYSCAPFRSTLVAEQSSSLPAPALVSLVYVLISSLALFRSSPLRLSRAHILQASGLVLGRTKQENTI